MPDRRRRSATPSTRCSDRRRPGGAAASARDEDRHVAFGGWESRGVAASPRAAGPSRRQRPRRMGEPGRAELHRPAALGAAGRAVRRAHVLRPVLASTPAPAGAARLHGPGLRGQRRRRAGGRARSGRHPVGRRRGDVAPLTVPGRVRAGAGGAGGGGRRAASGRGPGAGRRPPISPAPWTDGRPRPSRPPVRPSPRPASPGCSCSGGSAASTRPAWPTTAPRVATRRCGGPSSSVRPG